MSRTIDTVKATTKNDKVLLISKDNQTLSTGLLDRQSNYILCVESYDKKKDRYVVRYFANETEFEHYALQHLDNPHYRTALDKLHNMQVIRESAIRNGDIYKTDPSQYSGETKSLLESLGAMPGNNTASRAYGVLYDHADFSGTRYALTPWNPNYRSFRNKAESVKHVGDCFLCDLTWYRGTKVYIFGWPYGRTNLRYLHFANKAESNT